jgi:hypothetical protein
MVTVARQFILDAVGMQVISVVEESRGGRRCVLYQDKGNKNHSTELVLLKRTVP